MIVLTKIVKCLYVLNFTVQVYVKKIKCLRFTVKDEC